MHSNSPLLSVIIPTHKRPQYLPIAIDSALQSAPHGDVEVIVVPNGPDESWKSTANRYVCDLRVKWLPIPQANANAARNRGLEQARGIYIRFLDDDDYYYPDAAQDQVNELIRANADLSFADINLVNVNDHFIKHFQQRETNDYIAAALLPTHSTATISLTYKRSLTEGIRWDESVAKRQDMYWVWSLCMKHEITAIRSNMIVGAWVDHNLSRVSKGHSPNSVLTDTARILINTLEDLDHQGRLNKERKRAGADHLWHCVHQGLMYAPAYWPRIAKVARQLDPEGRPVLPIYQNPLIRKINPLLCESAIVPLRWIKAFLGHEYYV